MQCGKSGNQILCQFQQSWPLDKLVKTFLEFRKDFVGFSASTNKNTDSINSLNTLTHKNADSITNLNANPGNYCKTIIFIIKIL